MLLEVIDSANLMMFKFLKAKTCFFQLPHESSQKYLPSFKDIILYNLINY